MGKCVKTVMLVKTFSLVSGFSGVADEPNSDPNSVTFSWQDRERQAIWLNYNLTNPLLHSCITPASFPQRTGHGREMSEGARGVEIIVLMSDLFFPPRLPAPGTPRDS